MDQLHLLWEYQQADIAVTQKNNAIHNSPTRQKLIKYKNDYEAQQKAMKRLESEVSAMSDRMDALKDAVAMAAEQLRTLQTKMESDPAQNAETAAQYIAEAKRVQNNLTAYEQEIARIGKDAQDRDHQQHDVKMRGARAKKEFDTLKESYSEEKHTQDKELDKLKAEANEKAKAVEASLMERYNTIKRHSFPPLAQLTGDQCGGCMMSLPSAVSRKIKAGELVECETCGRLLIII